MYENRLNILYRVDGRSQTYFLWSYSKNPRIFSSENLQIETLKRQSDFGVSFPLSRRSEACVCELRTRDFEHVVKPFLPIIHIEGEKAIWRPWSDFCFIVVFQDNSPRSFFVGVSSMIAVKLKEDGFRCWCSTGLLCSHRRWISRNYIPYFSPTPMTPSPKLVTIYFRA